MGRLRFYFDISCPYAYIASTQVERVANRVSAELEPYPVLLGGVFRAHQTPQNLFEALPPQKAKHNAADMQRQAALAGVPLHMPTGHPIRTVEALRSMLVAGPPYMPLAHAFYRAYWVDGVDISTESGLRSVLDGMGLDSERILREIQRPEVKDELRARTDEAIARGVFGVPSFEVGDELYWGQDRLSMVERALGGDPPVEQAVPAAPVDVFFDYSSPFSYVGCAQAEAALGDVARWKPMLLGAIFKQVGTANVPLFVQNEAKRQFSLRDVGRQAEQAGIPFRFPSKFPMNTVLPLRVTIVAKAHETKEGRRLVHAIFRAYWGEGRDIGDPDVMAELCEECGLDGRTLIAEASRPPAKRALRMATSEAAEAGVFGAPTFVVHTEHGPELYWGADRLRLAVLASSGDPRAHAMAKQRTKRFGT